MRTRLALGSLLLALIWIGSTLVPRKNPGAFDLAAFGQLPVLANGRLKPMDTIARTSLLMLQGRQRLTAADGRTLTPEAWLLDVCFRPDDADACRVFRVDNSEVLSLFGLGAGESAGQVRFSFAQLRPGLPELERQAQLAEPVAAAARTAFQRAVGELRDHVEYYDRLKSMLGLPDRASFGTIETRFYAALGPAWRAQEPEAFNRLVRGYGAELSARFGPVVRRCRWENFFNRAEPFYTSLVLYVAAFLLAVISWLKWPAELGRAACRLMALAWLLATAGILARMWLEGRPPVTNLYSSALFIGWGAVGLCLILERINRNAVASSAGSLIGFGTLVIAHHLSLSGDTLEMMRAVLDSNFWLATHVVTVTTGYASTFLAGFLAIIYVLRGVLSRTLDRATADSLAGMVYGIVCFATLFSFVGTVLGGIWADQSWGRFWGWDPKENGALIIVIWNAVILHCRWGGLVRQRGLMCLAVFGNVVTAWSWFGTNMLGIGLHSYGFTNAAFQGLVVFVALQLAIIGLAAIPRARWRSAALGGAA